MPDRLRTAAAAIADVLRGDRGALRARAEGTPWSPLEYACHTRDVLFLLRDRIVVAMNEDVPDGKPLHRDARVSMGLYEGDEPAQVAAEVVMAADLFARTWERVPHELRERTMRFAYPTEAVRTLNWVAAQTLHEVEHHLGDMRRLLS